MVQQEIIDKIVQISDSEKGGDNALDGFEFQVSNAIYLMFKELKNNKEFQLLYEKLEDFIIITDKISLYQAKGLSNNLTPNILYKPSKKTKNDDSGLSIIEKMNANYLSVKEESGGYNVDNNLLICENQVYSNKMTKKVKDINTLVVLNFSQLDDDVKNEIIDKTKYDVYEWQDINAIRLIPKSRHEEITRIYIEDVVEEKFGAKKISSAALYNAISCEIRKVRKKKEALTSLQLIKEMNKIAVVEKKPEFKDYIYLLNDLDKLNVVIGLNFNIMLTNIEINNHINRDDYCLILKLVKTMKFTSIYDIYNIICNHADYEQIFLRLNEYEIKAIVLIAVIKEVGL